MAAYVADRVLTLPCYADLELEDVDRICGIIRGCRMNMDKASLLVIPALTRKEHRGGGGPGQGFPAGLCGGGERRSRTAPPKSAGKGYNLLDLPVNLGLAGCFRLAKYATEEAYRYAIQFDGDRQHRPEYMEAMR